MADNVKKRSSVSMQDRIEILEKLDEGIKINEVAKQYNVGIRTVYRIKQNAAEIQQTAEQGGEMARKRKRSIAYGVLDQKLYTWFLETQTQCDISDTSLRQKAQQLMQEVGKSSASTPSDTWIYRFKRRHNILPSESQEERTDVLSSAIKNFTQHFNQRLKDGNIVLENIYNMDETGLAWKALPRTILEKAGERRLDGNQIKRDRVTLGVCVNGTGSHKLPLLFIHKYETPRALRHYRNNLPVIYKSQKNAWINRQIFAEWYDSHFKPAVRQYQSQKGTGGKVILILDICSCHILPSEYLEDDHFEIVFLPLNISSLLQPMEQGITMKLKNNFRRRLLQRIFEFPRGVREFYTMYDIKDCINIIKLAWNDITPNDIEISWQHLLRVPGTVESSTETCFELQNLSSRIVEQSVDSDEINNWLSFCMVVEEETYEEEGTEDGKLREESVEIYSNLDREEIDRAFRTINEWVETQDEFLQSSFKVVRERYENI